MPIDQIDQIIQNAIKIMDSSKHQIFEICENAHSEWESLSKKLKQIGEETTAIITEVDRLEREYRKARMRLTEVSQDFTRFAEEDMKNAYEKAIDVQMRLTSAREKEIHLKARRDDLQQRVKNIDKTIERAEIVASQMNVVLEYLKGDLNQVPQLLESAKSRQLIGMKIILAQEEERRRIAREIHDGMAQSLANVVIRTEIAGRMLTSQEYATVARELTELKSQVRTGLEEVRRIIFNLRPMMLDDLGLIPTLRQYTQDFENRTKIRTQLKVLGEKTRLPSGVDVAVFRLSQEAFNNVQKHADASYVSLELDFQEDAVQIMIQDNGKGFNMKLDESDAEGTSHFGLIGMRERIELLEGKLTLESEKDRGTKITIWLPIGVML